ncbi:MAG: polysaccharide deacetylase family protein [Chloroflexaceae bacterium]|nr:polysaccharide deacetylase family protein [Chloroflexaceae bacterium]NJO07354.1 polysaccharide deacetylase family protein [Chloroflexaceae bacterium]
MKNDHPVKRHLLHVAGVGLGIVWLIICVVVPGALATPPPTTEAVVTLPVGPVTMPTSLPDHLPAIVGYSAYTVAENQTLEEIALLAGSDPQLIRGYNNLIGEALPGRPLIIPHLAGYEHTLVAQPLLVLRGNSDRPWVALTLDAGAGSEPTAQILAALRERDMQVTFFLTGRWIDDNPDLTRQIVADGHEVANHSYSHPDFRELSDEEIITQLAMTERALYEATGKQARLYFRPPFGAYDQRVLLQVIGQGYMPIYWTLDSLDSIGPTKSPAFLVERVTDTLSPEELRGAIILMHCGSQATAEAMPAILDRFTAMGLEVRTLSEVLGR